jgi:DNA polymerase-3 subunit epsilon
MLKLKRPIIFFDLETTGTDVQNDRIVEIALIRLSPDGQKYTDSFLVNPGIPIPLEATEVHGITNDYVANAPKFVQIAKTLHTVFAGCDIAGFNSNRFDVPLLYNEFERAGIDWDLSDVNLIDVGNLFKIQEPRTLEAAYRFYVGESLDDAHSAFVDTEATVSVFEKMLVKYEDIPTDIDELAVYSNFGKKRLGISGHFTYNDSDEIVFNFGKYKDEPITRHLDYLEWMHRSDFPADTKKIIRSILNNYA